MYMVPYSTQFSIPPFFLHQNIFLRPVSLDIQRSGSSNCSYHSIERSSYDFSIPCWGTFSSFLIFHSYKLCCSEHIVHIYVFMQALVEDKCLEVDQMNHKWACLNFTRHCCQWLSSTDIPPATHEMIHVHTNTWSCWTQPCQQILWVKNAVPLF